MYKCVRKHLRRMGRGAGTESKYFKVKKKDDEYFGEGA